MDEQQKSVDALRERLTQLLAEWGAEMSGVLGELEQRRAAVRDFEQSSAAHDAELAQLRERVQGDQDLVETLRLEAGAASQLQQECAARDLEIQRLNSELDSKQELIRALRRDAEGADRLKAEAKRRDHDLEVALADKSRLEQRVTALENNLAAASEAAEAEAAEESAELESMRAELEARKVLIKSLRADADRARTLESRLDEKREVIQELEASINRHGETIVELRRNAEAWKRKYRALKGSDSGTTSPELTMFTATDADAFGVLSNSGDDQEDRTIAIDMRRSLIEARRTSQGNGQK